MKCSEVRRLLDLLPGKDDLEPGETELLMEHLDSCPECMRIYESGTRCLEALSLLGIDSMEEEIPETALPGFWTGLEETVMGRLERPAPGGVRPLVFFGAGFAAAAGILLTLWFALPRGGAGKVPASAGTAPSPVADASPRRRLVPVKGPISPLNAPSMETQGGAIPVKWFRVDWPKFPGFMGETNSSDAVPAGDRGRF